MDHLLDLVWSCPSIVFLVPLAFTAFFGLLVGLTMAVGFVWARHVLAERRREKEERRDGQERPTKDPSPRRYISGEYAEFILH